MWNEGGDATRLTSQFSFIGLREGKIAVLAVGAKRRGLKEWIRRRERNL